jgi:pimeloyl-ACP methyl ester carboxylesterase
MPKLNKVTQPTNRWCNYAYSPLDFNSRSDRAKPTVALHPGWAVSPKMHAPLLDELADAGFFPVALNTKYGYANQPESRGYYLGANIGRLFTQSYRVGAENIHFPAADSRGENRYRLRRPTGVVSILQSLGIDIASLVGFSDGGRIMTTVAAESASILVPHLLVVNAAGTGTSEGGLERMARSARQTARDGSHLTSLTARMRKTAESVTYTTLHGRRFNEERRVIQSTDLWPALGAVSTTSTEVTVLHAREDQLVDYASSAKVARDYPGVDFVPTDGGHGNFYSPNIRAQIVSLLSP